MSKIIYIPAPATSAGFVPYTGATNNVNLSSTYYLFARNFKAIGTAGNGHYSMLHQASYISAGVNESNLFADVNGNLAWQNNTLYRTVYSTNSNTANRTYTFQNKDYTVADNADLAFKLNIQLSELDESLMNEALPLGSYEFLINCLQYPLGSEFSTNKMNELMGFENYSFESQRQVRSKFINSINSYFKFYHKMDVVIIRKISNEDKRMSLYSISEEYYDRLKVLVNGYGGTNN